MPEPKFDVLPFDTPYREKIRPILEAVDQLRLLKVTEEGITLPTIVVVGDQSSGKSSVLESLATIELPRGVGTVTRVPLVIRLKHHEKDEAEFTLCFKDKNVKIPNEASICQAIEKATVEVAGVGKGIANIPLTLLVNKRNVPDLTLVDLPGFIRKAIDDQPTEIYFDILDLVMGYIKPEETIILNVVNSWSELQMCESFYVSEKVDITGKRTIAVITKCDKCPENVFPKLKRKGIKAGLGFVCVRNRISDETYDEARKEEANLFDTDPILSELDKSMVGIPMLANKLMEAQAKMIAICLPNIVKKVGERLDGLTRELARLPRTLVSVSDARGVLMEMVGSIKDTLQNLIIRGEYAEYEKDMRMHGDARLIELLNKFSKELHSRIEFSEQFLVDELSVLQEANGIRLPQFLRHSAFLLLLQKRVNNISELPMSFINDAWGCLETICLTVFKDHCDHYRQLLPSLKEAAHKVLEEMKTKFKARAAEMIEMEQGTDYTCDPNHAKCLQKLLENRETFMNAIQIRKSSIADSSENRGYGFFKAPSSLADNPLEINIEGYGPVDIKHLVFIDESLREQAFDLKMRITAYWEVVVNRMVDWAALQLRFLIRKLVISDLQREISKEMMENDDQVSKMIAEPPSVIAEREALEKSIGILQESKEILQNAIDNGGKSLLDNLI